MIWLSSFPRSGNTFFRNVLFSVFGIESSSYYEGKGEPENYTDYQFVKCHLLPGQLIPSDQNIPAVYIIRDGRDALVSMAHQRKDLYEPDTDLYENIKEAIIAADGSYFGGWSNNVDEWIKRATIIVKFEDLIISPLEHIQRLNSITSLPEPDPEKLPSFNDLKFGEPKYGRGKRIAKNEDEEKEIIRKSFRKGKVNGWKDEMNEDIHDLFWSYHRDTMERTGYTYDGSHKPLNPDFDFELIEKLGFKLPKPDKKHKVLIEANKLLMVRNDGVKRYLIELIKALYPVNKNGNSKWQIDILIGSRIRPLDVVAEKLIKEDNAGIAGFQHQQKEKIKTGAGKILPQWLYKLLIAVYKTTFLKIKEKFFLLKSKVKTFVRRIRIKIYLKYRRHFKNFLFTPPFENYDLIHVPLMQHYEPFLKSKGLKFLITIHDITHRKFEHFHISRNVNLAEEGINFFKKQQSHYLAISESTKQDTKKEFDIAEDKIFTIYEAADNTKFKPQFSSVNASIMRAAYNIPAKPYLLALSTIEPRKNLINTIKAFYRLIDEHPELDINLVIAGKKGWKSQELFKEKHHEKVIFTGFVEEKHLPLLYNEAHALCYISFYEGFGLPPLEAMSCGTPVIFGNNSSMKELYSNCGLAAIPDDIENIKDQMYRIVTDKNLHSELSKISLKKSFDFSWRKTAEETLKAYEESISNA